MRSFYQKIKKVLILLRIPKNNLYNLLIVCNKRNFSAIFSVNSAIYKAKGLFQVQVLAVQKLLLGISIVIKETTTSKRKLIKDILLDFHSIYISSMTDSHSFSSFFLLLFFIFIDYIIFFNTISQPFFFIR